MAASSKVHPGASAHLEATSPVVRDGGRNFGTILNTTSEEGSP
jgi:hypothetical protein